MTAPTLERLTADDWPRYRAVRLAALADSPALFGSDLARERAFTEVDWRRRTAGATIASLDGAPVGVVGWHWSRRPVVADLVAMWVAPGGRGQGVGAALVRDVVDQTVVAQGATLELEVLVDNVVAVDLYRREGFVDVGVRDGIRTGDVLRRMRYAPGGAGERAT